MCQDLINYNVYCETFHRKGNKMFIDSHSRTVFEESDEEQIKELLIGRKVKVLKKDEYTADLQLDNGAILKVEANEGCGGCSNGWYSIMNLNNVDNAITNVIFDKENIDGDCAYSYKIFVFCEDTRINLLQVDGDDGNGYYGTGYTIRVIETKRG